MLKILQARLQKYVNCEFPDVQAGSRKRRTRDQIVNIHWITEKAREFQENIYFCLEKTDAGRDCGQEEKGTTEDEMAGWHHRLDGHEFE